MLKKQQKGALVSRAQAVLKQKKASDAQCALTVKKISRTMPKDEQKEALGRKQY